ncbi:diguanylate cyclase [Novosphingobium sp. PS1R-30]|uniref:diguanylate cyclase n=1 Tax=Novosphingobium anseongense TaxID=3133436 RepID=A0ABU8RUT7_9SPHN
MEWGPIRLLVVWLVAAFGLAATQPAFAAEPSARPTCHATGNAAEDYAAIARDPRRWNCTTSDWSVASAKSFLRFDLHPDTETPTAFSTRLTRFASIRVLVIGQDGTMATRRVTEHEVTPVTDDWMMSIDLPRIAGPIATVVVEIEGARHTGMISFAELTGASDRRSLSHELLIAGLCGMLCMPLLFNFAFFRVLRERFLLWHVLATACMLVHTLVTSGLINRFLTLDIVQLSLASAFSVAGGIAAASAFSADLIEPGKLDPIQRRLLRCVGLWMLPVTLIYLFVDGGLRPYVAPFYLGSLLPPMGLFVWVMVVAWRRGSRAVYYQAAAWTPVMVTASIRIGSALGLTDGPIEMLVAQHYALGLEVVITSLGVFDRLLAIRRERDLAVAEIRIIEEQSERDPLTGLLNRRGLENRFETLRAEGYRAMAVLDLDKFKSVNDTYGHITGDAVLCAAAEALEPDLDTRAIRLGGEEFLLLLRGDDVVNRAERRRQAIATRIAARVPGLDRMVTASMGLVEMPDDGGMRAEFGVLYGHCDRLLYEAKDAGRNRTMREKMQSFGGLRPRAA